MAITQVTISIKTTNAAFRGPEGETDDHYATQQVAALLHRVTVTAAGGYLLDGLPLRDYNGNTVGEVTVERDEK